MTEKTVEWYQKELADRFAYFYYQTDGTFNFPNSAEGDLLKMTQKMLNLMKVDHQPTFEVGEYYVDSRGGGIFKVEKIDESIDITWFNPVENEFFKSVYLRLSTLDKFCKPATTEQIAEFKRAEHFASKVRSR